MRTALSAACFVLSLLAAAAQVEVELVLDQEQLLRSESLPVRLRIKNYSGADLKLDAESNWLVVNVEGHEGKALARTGEIVVPKTFTIESSRSVSLRMDLMPYFGLNDPGHYTVSAKVRLPQFGKEFSTSPKQFDILSGTPLWEREFGVPGRTPTEIRRYVLQQAEFLKQLRLYVRVADQKDKKVFNVAPLGPVVSFSANTIEAHLDRSNNLHVLFQSGRNIFLYCVIEPDGQQIIRQTHEQTSTRPHLQVEDDGRILVSGGARKYLLSDLPPSRVAQTNDSKQAN